ncbi:hypothetical protein EVAR_39880_1 [Eumeta japonica]|uniref:Uncharacterized protein n=1 Tax=Eumeta variegata TaxID=151549 RepID=A0A4C1WQG6_EUMVA|nr:hypothetical protein EVAR_39880_1 [Eumeta japonica]
MPSIPDVVTSFLVMALISKEVTDTDTGQLTLPGPLTDTGKTISIKGVKTVKDAGYHRVSSGILKGSEGIVASADILKCKGSEGTMASLL